MLHKLLVTVFSGLHFTLVKFLKASVDRQIPQKKKEKKENKTEGFVTVQAFLSIRLRETKQVWSGLCHCY